MLFVTIPVSNCTHQKNKKRLTFTEKPIQIHVNRFTLVIVSIRISFTDSVLSKKKKKMERCTVLKSKTNHNTTNLILLPCLGEWKSNHHIANDLKKKDL
jgi:hypothetical protein